MIIIIILNVIGITFALEPEKIYLIDLKYDEGNIKILKIHNTFGYYPDRIVQPDTGYTFTIVGENDEQELYTFKFSDPGRIYTDISNENGHLSGGIVYLNKTEFSIIAPYFPDAKKFIIYSQNNQKISEHKIEYQRLGEKVMSNLILTIILFIILFIIYLLFKLKNFKKRNK